MIQLGYYVCAFALAVSFVLSLILTSMARRYAIRTKFLDHPGERKVHEEPVPLLGGAAIAFSFFAVFVGVLAGLRIMHALGYDWMGQLFRDELGNHARLKVCGFLVGAFVIFVLGIIDDLKVLSPEMKLVGQIAAALVLVFSGMRIQLFFVDNVVLSALVTVLWVVTLSNSLNFLDNMDGLAGGIAVIAAFSFFLSVQPYQQHLVRLMLVIFAGAVSGFLYFNMNPARIFMGDAGAMFCGFFLAAIGVMGTFHLATTPSPIAVAAPVLALSVPLFDTMSVVYIRWRNGESIMKGDKRHFSHRLVELGMTHRQAVEFIFLVALVTGIGGALLAHVGFRGTLLIVAQTVGVYLLIVLLMNAGKNSK